MHNWHLAVYVNAKCVCVLILDASTHFVPKIAQKTQAPHTAVHHVLIVRRVFKYPHQIFAMNNV